MAATPCWDCLGNAGMSGAFAIGVEVADIREVADGTSPLPDNAGTVPEWIIQHGNCGTAGSATTSGSAC